MEFKITKEQVKEIYRNYLHNQDYLAAKALKEWFPEAFKPQFEVNKWYKIDRVIFYCTDIDAKGHLYGCGLFDGIWKEHLNDNTSRCACNALAAERLAEATKEEVESALISQAKKKGYIGKEIVLMEGKLSGAHSKIKMRGEFSFEEEQNRLMCKCDSYYSFTIFKDGIWATILPAEKTTEWTPAPTEKTVISLKKALKILAKKLKVSPENIEIE